MEKSACPMKTSGPLRLPTTAPVNPEPGNFTKLIAPPTGPAIGCGAWGAPTGDLAGDAWLPPMLSCSAVLPVGSFRDQQATSPAVTPPSWHDAGDCARVARGLMT